MTARTIAFAEEGASVRRMSRIASILDFASMVAAESGAVAERRSDGATILSTSSTMRGDTTIRLGMPGAPAKTRIECAAGVLAVSRPHASGFALPDDPAAAVAVELERLRSAFAAAVDARTMFRPYTVRCARERERIASRLRACAVHAITEGGPDPIELEAPTPWSVLRRVDGPPLDDAKRLWRRMPAVIRVHVLPIDPAQNSWSVEIGSWRERSTMPEDAMATMRVLATLPRRPRRR